MQNTHSLKILKRRKFLLMLPLLTLPFITLTFWALGGGSSGHRPETTANRGLNPQLPQAKLKEETAMDKLSFYDQAREDAIRLRQERLNDPYYKFRLDTMAIPSVTSTPFPPTASANGLHASPYPAGTTTAAEKRITERLHALHKALETPDGSRQEEPMNPSFATSGIPSTDISRLENMMEALHEKGESDPEVKALNDMLEKILDIQHPDRVKDRLHKTAAAGKPGVLSVSRLPQTVEASYLGKGSTRPTGNGFYSERDVARQSEPFNTIAATTVQTQRLTTGASVKLQLAEEVVVAGTHLPKGTFVFGRATLQNDRLLISVTGIRYKDRLYPVALTAFDLDGLPGLYVPGSITRTAVKNSASQNLGSLELLAYDPSLKGQAAAAGIQTAKSLLSKKAKGVKVTLKAGYTVLLKEDSAAHLLTSNNTRS